MYIQKYREKFSKQNDALITKWPNSFELYSWHVKLMRSGHQKSHIHPSGWISGVFYIKIPKDLSKNQGAIKFNIHGYGYPIRKKEIPNIELIPKDGDLVLFPSS